MICRVPIVSFFFVSAIFAGVTCPTAFAADDDSIADAFNTDEGEEIVLDSKSSELINKEKALLKEIAGDTELAPAQKIVAGGKVHSADAVHSAPPQVVTIKKAADTKAAPPVVVPEQAPIIAEAAKLEAAKLDLENKLSSSQTRVDQLLKEVEETRNRLMIAETEVERLSSIIQERNRTKISSVTKDQELKEPVGRPVFRPASNMKKPVAALPASRPVQTTESDMQIATVMVDKAHLRTGPGLNNSPLMAVSRGTRLAVETRIGDWYRVISPTGSRAWVSSDVVVFGVNGASSTQALKVGGYDSKAEDRAFDLVKSKK